MQCDKCGLHYEECEIDEEGYCIVCNGSQTSELESDEMEDIDFV
jgi:hypothetical protein